MTTLISLALMLTPGTEISIYGFDGGIEPKIVATKTVANGEKLIDAAYSFTTGELVAYFEKGLETRAEYENFVTGKESTLVVPKNDWISIPFRRQESTMLLLIRGASDHKTTGNVYEIQERTTADLQAPTEYMSYPGIIDYGNCYWKTENDRFAIANSNTGDFTGGFYFGTPSHFRLRSSIIGMRPQIVGINRKICMDPKLDRLWETGTGSLRFFDFEGAGLKSKGNAEYRFAKGEPIFDFLNIDAKEGFVYVGVTEGNGLNPRVLRFKKEGDNVARDAKFVLKGMLATSF